ncbi:methyl-accepting chemotaxis protein, partial [Pseudomonas syringae]|nr:methyl-accepting chemotaxis protein [Pseudomonas syringae]
QQSAGTEEINRSEPSVRDIADQSASAPEKSEASTVERARRGSDLKSRVARFKI